MIETSIGLDRMFLLIMCNSIKEETLKDGEKRTYLKFPFNLSPVKLAILPLTKKNDLLEGYIENKKIFKLEIK